MTAAGDITISVVIPCYNGGRYLGDAIESALGQTFAPHEVIVVDDGSTDDSAAIAERYGPPVRVLRQANQGESVARNKGIDGATGSHIAFLDADDMLAPTSYERLVQALEGIPQGVACMGCASFTTDPTEPHSTTFPPANDFLPTVFRRNLGECHCWLAPKNVIDKAGRFCGRLTYFEDWDLWWRVGLAGAQLVPVQFAGAQYRHHPQSQMATAKIADRALGHVEIKQRMGTALLEQNELLAQHGETMFWSCWAALDQARRTGATWQQLSPLTHVLDRLISQGPDSVRHTRCARLVRWIGLRGAHTCYRLTNRESA